MAERHPFDGALHRVEQLREHYDGPMEVAVRKDIGRLDTLENVVATGRAGLVFVIPGRDTTLRVNGRAAVSAEPGLLARLTPVGKPPRTAIVVEAEEVYNPELTLEQVRQRERDALLHRLD